MYKKWYAQKQSLDVEFESLDVVYLGNYSIQ